MKFTVRSDVLARSVQEIHHRCEVIRQHMLRRSRHLAALSVYNL